METQVDKPGWARHFDFVVIDLMCMAVAFVVSYLLKFGDCGFVDSSSWKALFAMLLLVNLVITLVTGPYDGIFSRRYWEDVGAYLVLAIESFLVACVVFYLFKIGEVYSREMLITTYLIYLALSLFTKHMRKRRLLVRKADPPEGSVRRLVLVTSAERALEAEAMVRADDVEAYKVVGFCAVDGKGDSHAGGNAPNSTDFTSPPAAAPGASGVLIGGKPCVAIAELVSFCEHVNVDEVLVLENPAVIDTVMYDTLIEGGVRVSFGIAEAIGVSSEVQALGHVGALSTLDLDRYSFGSGQLLYLPVKRVFDVALGFIGCIVALLLTGVVKLAYLTKGDSYPVIYRQERVGLRGNHFEMWKLRTMVQDADAQLEVLLQDPELRAQWECNQKLDDDPRITEVGRFLRRTSLDEFPQFYNVVKGDMSIVGPRPLVPGELEAHGGRALYHKVKPGIAGWWGCNGRSNIDYRERLELEYHYVRNCSLYLDVLCLVRTTLAVLRRDDAL